ncbi:MAG: methylmalonyl-CoA mutase family protein [Pseudomonadota bacterium]
MADDLLTFGDGFDGENNDAWNAIATKALKGKDPNTYKKSGVGGIATELLYQEDHWPSGADPHGQPGAAPFIRGADAVRDRFLPWDIRQAFTHPDPTVTNQEILRDLERGVSSVELKIDCTGQAGCSITDLDGLQRALDGVRADIATLALDHGGGTGTSAAALLALWAETQDEPKHLKLAFNIDPLGSLARLGLIEGGLDAAMARCAALHDALSLRFPNARTIRIDARMVHEAGGVAGDEVGVLIASAIDTLRRLDALGVSPDRVVPKLLFCVAVDAEYSNQIAKLRAVRRLWARCLEALGLPPAPIAIQAVTAARMLTRYDPWVNLLRNTAACFAAGVGGADIVTVRPFNDPLGVPEELGRRTARNTQIIAQEESQLGRVADPGGGAWHMESIADQIAQGAWAFFQRIEAAGGYAESLQANLPQSEIAENRAKRKALIAKRILKVTGVSEFPILTEIEAPVADAPWSGGADGVSDAGLRALLPKTSQQRGEDTIADPFWPMRVAEPFERLRDIAAAREAKTGTRPSIFLATLGPLADHTARVDYARNFFAAGGIEGNAAPTPPQSHPELVAAFQASGCRLAVLCGSNQRYIDEAAEAAQALRQAGAQRLYLAGKPGDHESSWTAAGVDSFIYIGVDVVDTLELAHSELGLSE